MDRFELLKNLLVIAVADGSLNASEFAVLTKQANSWGLSDERFVEAVEYALSDDSHLRLPSRQDKRDELRQYLSQVIAADGDFSDVEQELVDAAFATVGPSTP